MKRHIIASLLLSLLGTMIVSGQQIARMERIDMPSRYFQHKRPVLIYTPANFDEETMTDYDVIYVFDAQWRSTFDFITVLAHHELQQFDENIRPYIVVGICSPHLPEIGYARNSDYTPMPVKEAGRGLFREDRYFGHSSDLKAFLREELMPYLKQNYRANGHSLAVGHSLSASFVMDAMLNDELFDDIIAMSPNCEYDDFRPAKDFINYDFTRREEPRFVYLSMGNEPETWVWDNDTSWGDSWYRVKNHADSIAPAAGNCRIITAEFPEYTHNRVRFPAIQDALKHYFAFMGERDNWLGKEEYPVHIELHGADLAGSDVYITGNQEALGQWQPSAVKMAAISDTLRAIDLRLRLPACFKFTKGDWDHQIAANPETSLGGNIRITTPRDTVSYTTSAIPVAP